VNLPLETADPPLALCLGRLFHGKTWGNFGEELYKGNGPRIFQSILKPDYGPFDGEVSQIKKNMGEIVNWIGSLDTAILIGPGPSRSVREKELRILERVASLKRVIIIELSEEFNKQSTQEVSKHLPHVDIVSFQSDFMKASLGHIPYNAALVISTGSMTNFERCPMTHFPHGKVGDHLDRMAELAKIGGKFLWAYDQSLEADFYNTYASDFLLEPLRRAERTAGIQLSADTFRHLSVAETQGCGIFHKWENLCDQEIVIGETVYYLTKGDRFSCFTSGKFPPHKITRVAQHHSLKTALVFEDQRSGAVIHGFDRIQPV